MGKRKETQRKHLSSPFCCKNKKGTILDFLYLVIILFIFAIISVIMYPVFVEVNQGLNESGVHAEQLQNSVDVQNKYVGITDGIFLFILVGLSIAALIGAMMINTHPAFYPIAAFLLALFAIINGILSNAFTAVAEAPVIVDYSGQFLITNFVMGYLPWIILIISFIVAIVLFAKGGE